ncbi:MAG TPA: DUF1698 domain-containing protein [Caulobacteraceae bacterium]|jgi:tRNA (mo5U34)-methyltransferase
MTVDLETARNLVASRPWWYHRFEIYPGLVTPGVYDPSGTLFKLDLPDDLTGATILEIGPAEGFFTRELVKRGAKVTAVDYMPKHFHGFAMMEELAGIEFDFRQANLYDLKTLDLGTFDIVLCLGVLYHLPDPVRALWTLRDYVKGQLILETLISREFEDVPCARYLPADSSNGDITNFWAPNPMCCKNMLEDVGFKVRNTWLNDTRGMFHCAVDENPNALTKITFAYGTNNWGQRAG